MSLPDTDEKVNLANMNNVFQKHDEKMTKNRHYTSSSKIDIVLQDYDEIKKHNKEQSKETASMNIAYQIQDETSMNDLYQLLDAARKHNYMDKEIKDNLNQAVEEFKKRNKAQLRDDSAAIRGELGMIIDCKTVRNYVVKVLRVLQGELNKNSSQKLPFFDIFFLKLFSIEKYEQSIKPFSLLPPSSKKVMSHKIKNFALNFFFST